jgi:hypothetical protein
VSGGPWHNPGGEVYYTYVRVEAYGRTVPDALALQQGDVVLCEGKLAWQRGSGQGSKAVLGVTAWRILRKASEFCCHDELPGGLSVC